MKSIIKYCIILIILLLVSICIIYSKENFKDNNIGKQNKIKYGDNYDKLMFIHIPKTGGTTVTNIGKILGKKWGDVGKWKKNELYHCEGKYEYKFSLYVSLTSHVKDVKQDLYTLIVF